jgi:hypothetical protein
MIDPQTKSQSEERSATTLMLFAVISGIFVMIAVGVGVLYLLRGVTPGAALGDASAAYNVPLRVIPDEQTVPSTDQLLPPMVGEFQRLRLSGGFTDYVAVYVKGDDQVTVTGGQAVTSWAAQALVQFALDSSPVASQTSRIISSDPGYSYALFRNSNQNIFRFVYSHERWYFDVEATSAQALDEFMTGFPF